LAYYLSLYSFPTRRSSDLARVGLALYGLSPLEDGDPAVLGLRPVMRLVSTVINLKDIPAGHGASYGLTFTAATDTRFALVPGGRSEEQRLNYSHVSISYAV